MDVERTVIPEHSEMYRKPITKEMAQAKCEQFYTKSMLGGHKKCDGEVTRKMTLPIIGVDAIPYWQCNSHSICSVN